MDKRHTENLFLLGLVLLDTVLGGLALVMAYWLRTSLPVPEPIEKFLPLVPYIGFGTVQLGCVLLMLYFYRMYHQIRSTSRVDQFYAIAAAVSIGTLLAVAANTILFQNTNLELNLPRALLVYVWIFSIIGISFGRLTHQWVRFLLLQRGIGTERVLIIGSGEIAQVVVQKIKWNPDLGYQLVGVVNGKDSPPAVLGVPVIGLTSELTSLLDRYAVDEVIVAVPAEQRPDLLRIIADCQRGQVTIKVFPDVFEIMAGEVSVDEFAGLPMLNVRDVALRGWRLSLKRAFDIFGAIGGLLLTAPIMLVIGLLVKLESRGPALFIQERVGLDGKPFRLLKFRSMRIDAPNNLWTVKDDPRRTKVGSFIRKYSIDELPQFINVLLGQMSLVGPRPEQPHYVEEFRQRIPRYMERHREKAGVTGWAQVNGLRGNTSIEERTKYDLWYIEHWSLWLDIKIIIRTVLQAVGGRGY